MQCESSTKNLLDERNYTALPAAMPSSVRLFVTTCLSRAVVLSFASPDVFCQWDPVRGTPAADLKVNCQALASGVGLQATVSGLHAKLANVTQVNSRSHTSPMLRAIFIPVLTPVLFGGVSSGRLLVAVISFSFLAALGWVTALKAPVPKVTSNPVFNRCPATHTLHPPSLPRYAVR